MQDTLLSDRGALSREPSVTDSLAFMRGIATKTPHDNTAESESTTHRSVLKLQRLQGNRRVQRVLGASGQVTDTPGESVGRAALVEPKVQEAQKKFDEHNTALTPDEQRRIHSALRSVVGDNSTLWIAFYEYYSSHEIKKAGDADAEKLRSVSDYGKTSHHGGTIVRPEILAEGFSSIVLGSYLIEQLTFTKFPQSESGSGFYLRGESLAIRYVLLERAGDKDQAKRIRENVDNAAKEFPAQASALRSAFEGTRVLLQILYRRVDSKSVETPFGELTEAEWKIVTDLQKLTSADALEMITELVAKRPSKKLENIKELVRRNRLGFELVL